MNLNFVSALKIEEDTIVTAAETESCQRGFESLYVSRMGGTIVVNAVKDLEGGGSINGPQIGTGVWGTTQL